MPALAPPLRTSCFINVTDSTSLRSGLLANTSLWRPARFFLRSTNIPGHLLFSGNKGLSNPLLLVQEEVLKPICMRESLNRKRIQSKKKKKRRGDMNLYLIACWAQKAANWLDTFRGWIHIQKQIFSFKEDVCHLHLFHGFRPKSIWHEENLIWLFIQIISPALIATLLPRGNHGQRDPGSHALKTLDWSRVGVQ